MEQRETPVQQLRWWLLMKLFGTFCSVYTSATTYKTLAQRRGAGRRLEEVPEISNVAVTAGHVHVILCRSLPAAPRSLLIKQTLANPPRAL